MAVRLVTDPKQIEYHTFRDTDLKELEPEQVRRVHALPQKMPTSRKVILLLNGKNLGFFSYYKGSDDYFRSGGACRVDLCPNVKLSDSDFRVVLLSMLARAGAVVRDMGYKAVFIQVHCSEDQKACVDRIGARFGIAVGTHVDGAAAPLKKRARTLPSEGKGLPASAYGPPVGVPPGTSFERVKRSAAAAGLPDSAYGPPVGTAPPGLVHRPVARRPVAVLISPFGSGF